MIQMMLYMENVHMYSLELKGLKNYILIIFDYINTFLQRTAACTFYDR